MGLGVGIRAERMGLQGAPPNPSPALFPQPAGAREC